MTKKKMPVKTAPRPCPPGKTNRPNPRRRRRRVPGIKAGPGAPIVTAAAVTGDRGRGVREQGTDLLWSQAVPKGERGTVLQAVISPELFPRLSQLAKSFQRIRYHRLRFEIVASWPTTTAGTYVSGFVKDATDPVRGSSAASTLLASGGTATKVWQSTEVIVGRLPDLYYTSSDPNSERWSSPGSFVISLISPPTVEGSLEVFVHWDVTLTEPTYEEPEGSSDDGFTAARFDFYTSKNNPYLSKRSKDTWAPVNFGDFSPPLKDGDTVRFLSFKFGSVQNSSQVLSGLFGFHTVKAIGSYVYPVDDKGDRSTENFYDEVYVIAKGEKGQLERARKDLSLASWYLSPPAPSRPLPIARSWCRHEAPNLRGAGRCAPRTSYSPDCMESTSPEPTSPTSETLGTSFERSETLSNPTLPSTQDRLYPLLEKLMEHLELSQVRSSNEDWVEVSPQLP